MKNILTLTPETFIYTFGPLYPLVTRFSFFAMLLATMSLLSGCGPEVWKWSEEAKLEGGKKIVVEREVTFGGARLPWEHDRPQSEYILRFASPNNPATKFEYRSIGGLMPGLLAFVNGTPYVLGEIVRGDAQMYYGCADPAFIIHRYESGRWKRAELSDIPATITKKNLAMFSKPAMANAEAGQRATSEQVAGWNGALGTRDVGKYAKTERDEIPRPTGGVVIYDCSVTGGTKMGEAWKADFRARSVPSITE